MGDVIDGSTNRALLAILKAVQMRCKGAPDITISLPQDQHKALHDALAEFVGDAFIPYLYADFMYYGIKIAIKPPEEPPMCSISQWGMYRR